MRYNVLFILAFIIFLSCTDEKTRQADNHFKAGEQKIIARDFAGAEADFTKAIELDPERYTPYHGRGEVRLMIGKKEEGLADLKQAMVLMEKHHDMADPQYKSAHEGIRMKYEMSGGK